LCENFEIVAAFDSDPDKTGRVVCGRRCYPMPDLETVIRENQLTLNAAEHEFITVLKSNPHSALF